jgi:uncharacterized protein
LYNDAASALEYLLNRGFKREDIIIYGRSIGTGVAVDLASKENVGGLILEAPYTSLPDLADEKLPFLFPSLYIKFRFDNMKKIEKVHCPVIFVHGDVDTIIPHSHTQSLYEKFTGKKKLILITGGSHNDLNAFDQYTKLIVDDIRSFF